MRISTNTIYDRGVSAIEQQQSAMLKIQQQVSSGKRMVAPSDDPVAAARALDVAEADAVNKQYGQNGNSASSALGMEDSALQSISTVIQNARTILVNAGNGVLTNNDRAGLAADLRGQIDQLLGLANTTDGAGHYLFAGYQNGTQPFVRTGSGIIYAGDDGQRLLQLAAGRQVPVTDSGRDVFERIRTGNGVFATQANAGNTGSGIIGQGSVLNVAALTGDSYAVQFSVAAGATTYSVTDTTKGVVLSAGNAYTTGNAITFDGMQVDIQGAPADGDQFTITPSVNQSLFKTLDDVANVLAAPANDAAGRARLSNTLGAGISNLDQALDKVLSVRSAVGSRLQEVDALQGLSQDLSLQYQTTLSQLQDVDYASAISDLTRIQMSLQAAQQSFVKVTSLSLFEYL